MLPPTIEWVPDRPDDLVPGRVRMIDQTRLPGELVFIETDQLPVVYQAIRTLRVRGAPAIGVAAAMGLAAAAQHHEVATGADLVRAVARDADHLATARPTAVNLFAALERMRLRAAQLAHLEPADLRRGLVGEAVAIAREECARSEAIGRHGLTLLGEDPRILTICNAGALATVGPGTALAPLHLAAALRRHVRVYACETRPLLQGARLTAWELRRSGIDVTLICDSVAAVVLREGRVDAVFAGADRIAANGDTANKIGTYALAVLAQAHDVPFYVLAPTTTFDLSLADGSGIPIEERDGAEVTDSFGFRTAPEGVRVFSPAFDVTPAPLIAGIVCENGVARPHYAASLRAMADVA